MARFALQLDTAFYDSDDHFKSSLAFDRLLYEGSPLFEQMADAVLDSKMMMYQEEVVTFLV